MKNRFWKKTAAGLLALLIVAGGTPIQPLSQVFEKTAITASAASTVDVPCSVDTSSFEVITDVKILGAEKAKDIITLTNEYRDDGWTVIEQDLNQGAKGWYIYLAYKTATVTQQSDLSNAIRDIIIVNGSDNGKKTTLSGITDTTLSSTTSRTFYKCDSDGDFSNDDNQGDVGNLNRGTGSGTPDLYMYYTREAGYDKSFLTSLSLSTSSSGAAYCYNNSGDPADLNPSGNAAYLHLSRKSVRASYYGFTANTDLVYSGSAQTLASPKSAYHGTVYWSVNGGSWTTSQPKATNAGEYTVKSYVKGDFGFGDSPEVSTTVTIAKSDANKPTVAIDSPAEAGKAYSPVLAGMAADRTGAVTYLYSDSQNGEYSSAQPSTEGTYWVKAEIAEDSNYNAYTTAPVSFKILNRSRISVSTYENGTVTSDKDTALTGETVTLNISPTYNHFVKSITVNDDELSPVDGVYSFEMPSEDAVIAAEFAQIKSAVVWKNWDGNVLETDEDVHYGTTPEYNGKTPTKAATAQYTYTFSGWSPAISSVEGNIEYTAQFSQTVNQYTVKWVDGDGNILKTETLDYGSMPSAYNGDTPTKTADAQYTYTFSGWDNELSDITGDTTYTAQFSQTVNKYTVTWKNGDTVLETDENVEYGTTPEYNGEIPTKAGNAQYTYPFSGWSPEVDTVTGNVTYTAQFSQTVNKYTVTWKNGDTVLETDENVEYGTTPEYNGETPTKAMDDDYTYTFSGWSPEISSVEGDIEYTAQFTATARPKCGDKAYWEFDSESGKLTISGTGAMYDYEYDYKTDTVNSPWNGYKDNITSVEIENGITSIGSSAFHSFAKLTSVSIPDSVKSIGREAFFSCTGLTSITIPDSVKSIGAGAFSGCTGITSITISDSVTSIGREAFFNCSSLTSIEIPDSVTSIEAGAFFYCESLKSITIPDSVTSIGDYAFSFCQNLTSITIPVSITSIGTDAFHYCTNITDVYCYADPKNLTWYDSNCDDFIRSETGKPTICHVSAEHIYTYNSEKFSDVNVTFKAEAMGKCGDHATWFFDSKTGKLTISGMGAMYDYSYNTLPWYNYKDNITSVEIEKGITRIGSTSFCECTNLTSVEIPDSVTSIGGDAFNVCKGLTSITIPDSVTSIGMQAFRNCKGLTSITIPDSVTSIGRDAFWYCTNITDVYCYANPANLTWNEGDCDDFKSDGTTVCHVPAEYIETYNTKFGAGSDYPVNVTFKAEAMDKCGDHAYWFFDSKTGKLTISGTGDMADYEFDTETLTGNSPWNGYKDNITSVEIENGITSIGNCAFFNCTGLTSITIPDSVTSIDAGAFSWCTNLTSVKMSKNVTSIGEGAFWFCEGLKSITIPDSVTNIGGAAFEYCTSLTSITIPDSVTSIGDYTFCGCESLEKIKIPASVTSIGEAAFEHCTSLTSITIPNSVTSIGRRAFYNCTKITDVYCYADPKNLTWDVELPDFKSDGTTVCHVREEYLGKYNEKFGSSVNVTFVGDLDAVDMGLGEHLYGHSITLDGSIGVNFYVELTDELLASETAEMVFTVPNGSKTDTQTLLVKDVIANDNNKVSIGSRTYYKFKCNVSAKDMALTITAQLVDGEKSGKEYTYSVKDYAEYLLEHNEVEEFANAAPLVKAMLNYGAASQRYFNEGTAIGEVEDMADVTVPNTFKFDEGNADLPEGVTFEGATLSLKSETTLSLYFKGLPADTKFICDSKTVETAKNGDYVVARIRGIKANELENDFTVTFEGDSVTYNVTYNVMTYCYNVQNDDTVDDNLKNVCKALYKYAQAAINYAE